MKKERGQSAIQYLMVIGIGSMMVVIVVFLLLNPFQSARKKAERYTTEAACQIQTGIDEYKAEERYDGSLESAPEQLIDETGNKTFNRTGPSQLLVGEDAVGDCPYESTIEGSCELNGYNLSLVNHPCSYGAENYKKALYLEKDSSSGGGWVNYTRIK